MKCRKLCLDVGTRLPFLSLYPADGPPGVDGSIYFIDENGSRVQRCVGGQYEVSVTLDVAVYGCHGGRYFDGHTTSVAGRQESGSEASQLEARLVVQWSTYVSFLVLREDAEDIFVTREGVLYVSDSGNNRIQKWLPGATEGVTVAGGNGKGSRLDQLQHPVGLHITEDSTIYIADYQNHRIMKWREGWQHGLVVSGGQGNGDELYQLYEPIDVTFDSQGALYVADNGNARVVRWCAPSVPYEQILPCTSVF
ncbi:Trim71 [Symbiodinium natans]|uniref:Trim71 protein n=1 Tax=Symbiodinium natans TaxID=878477 RepID=A0A812V626_9DINO|nr:Trim71 [Symbiodinium natans]